MNEINRIYKNLSWKKVEMITLQEGTWVHLHSFKNCFYPAFILEQKLCEKALNISYNSDSIMAKHIETGKKGEELALEFLKKKGYEILAKNWRFRRSEIDIIAKDHKILVFIEVKTRSYDYFGKPESFVSKKKKMLMQDAASAYMREINHTWEIRFDIIGILIHRPDNIEINHFEDAFFPGL